MESTHCLKKSKTVVAVSALCCGVWFRMLSRKKGRLRCWRITLEDMVIPCITINDPTTKMVLLPPPLEIEMLIVINERETTGTETETIGRGYRTVEKGTEMSCVIVIRTVGGMVVVAVTIYLPREMCVVTTSAVGVLMVIAVVLTTVITGTERGVETGRGMPTVTAVREEVGGVSTMTVEETAAEIEIMTEATVEERGAEIEIMTAETVTVVSVPRVNDILAYKQDS